MNQRYILIVSYILNPFTLLMMSLIWKYRRYLTQISFDKENTEQIKEIIIPQLTLLWMLKPC